MKQNQSLLFVIAEWWEERKANSAPTIPNRRHVWHWFLPTPGNVIFTLLVIGSLLWAQNAGAISLSAPVVNSSLTIPYQGRLANASGAPFTGNQNMEFRLYNTPSGGTPLWTEFWTGGNAVNVSDGLFSVLLGSLQNGLPSVVQSNSQLWLGITVGTDGEMSPRVQLGSAAYSMQALTVPDGSITGAKLADSSVTVADLADSSINSAKIQDGAIVTNDLADGSVNSTKLELSHGTKCLSAISNYSLPGNWAWVAVPELTLPFALSKDGSILVWMDGLASFNGQSQTESDVALWLDEVNITSEIGLNHPNWFNVNGQRILSNVSAGNHTLQLRLTSQIAGQAALHGLGPYATCINYIIL